MIVQSFWSKPFLKDSNHPNARFKGGWLHEKYFYYSTALSCLKFKEFYKEVDLYTDTNGEKILKTILNIPYSNYHNTLDPLNDYHENLWALPKLHTYSNQNTPFIHADTDVFIWEKFSDKIVNNPIFCQNIEDNYPIYGETLDHILQILDWIPTEIINSLYKHKRVVAFNAGVLGGTDLDFYKKLYRSAIKMIQENNHLFHKIDVGMLNMIYEQHLGHAIADKNNISIHPLFENIDPKFTQLTNFHLAGFHTKYVHAIGYAKKSVYACEQIEALLLYEFPEYYNRIKHNGLHNSLWKEQYEIKESRKNFLLTMFQWLRNNSISHIYNTKFSLNSSVKILDEGETITILFTKPQTNEIEKLELIDWDNILLYFQEPLSINELCNELMNDSDISKKYTKDKLLDKILSFVIDKCLIHEIFIPENVLELSL